jgi:uncharacterized protein involved in high-affinity Fe2+ transport
MRVSRRRAVAVVFGLVFGTSGAWAKEVPIGETKRIAEAGLEIAAVYLQPIEMEPAAHEGKTLYLTRDEADVHLEADIHALAGNKQGFKDGEWIPGMTVRYALKHVESGQEQAGILHPMVASDGPHYGANLKMMGAGSYTVTFLVEPPGQVAADAPVRHGLGLAAGRAAWWKPFRVQWTFKYLGPPKAGY